MMESIAAELHFRLRQAAAWAVYNSFPAGLSKFLPLTRAFEVNVSPGFEFPIENFQAL